MHLGNLEKANVAQAGDRRGERRERRLEVRAGAALSPAAGVVFFFCLKEGFIFDISIHSLFKKHFLIFGCIGS